MFCFVLAALAGCVDRLIEQSPPASPIRYKHYNKPPLPRGKLDELLRMAVYRGAPDKYGDMIMRGRSVAKGMNPVLFSHRIHRVRYTCRVCHVELEFSMRKGESGITREDYLDGRFCGACHNGKIAFSVEFSCNLCHIDEKNLGSSFVDPYYEILADSLPSIESGDRIDWTKAIKSGAITPKSSLYEDQPSSSMPLPEYLNEPLQWYTNTPRVYVSFPHKEHVAWLDCANCHPDTFKIESFGTEEFDKEKNLYGLYCGVCHMTVAFPMNECNKCHPSQKRNRYKGK